MMKTKLTRRGFLGTTAAMGAAFSTFGTGALKGAEPAAKKFKTELHKAFICDKPTEENVEAHAEAGFEGFEVTDYGMSDDEIKAGKKLADDYGLRVHSIMRGGWDLPFNGGDDSYRKVCKESVRKALRTASLFGADTILLVPARIGELNGVGYPIPNPGDLNIEFNPDTLEITKVVDGDNTPYQAYIDDHNRTSAIVTKTVEELIPAAAYYGVIIAIENVWNNLWLQPEIFAAYVRRFDDLWVKAYYDMGNHAKYAPTSDWLRALGKDVIAKLHLKDFAIEEGNPNTMFDGFCGFGTGTIDWADVRNTIEEIGYNGWVSYEENAYTPEGYGKRMDQWINGQPITG